MARPTGDWKHFAIAFAIALVGYVVLFNWIEHRRIAKGPWEVTFRSISGRLELVVTQPALSIRDVRVQFPTTPVTTNLHQTVRFTPGHTVPFEVPFGRCVFMDPLYLPGTVALEIAGHKLQLLPRVLTLDGKEQSWKTTNVFELRGSTNHPTGIPPRAPDAETQP